MPDSGLLKRLRANLEAFSWDRDLLCVSEFDCGSIKDVSAAWVRLLGWQEIDLRGVPLRNLIHPDDLTALLAITAKRPGDRSAPPIARFMGQNGAWHWLEWRRLEGASTEEFCALAQDVTASQHRLKQLEQVVDATRAADWELDLKSLRIRPGPGWTQALGWSAKELGTDARALRNLLLANEDRLRLEQAIERHLLGETDYYEVELSLRRKDGAKIWAHDRGRIVRRAPDGTPLVLAGAWLDITDRKMAELAREAAEAEARAADRDLREAIAALPDGFFLFDAEDRLTNCNERMRELFPKVASDLVPGVHFLDILRIGLEKGQIANVLGHETAFHAGWLAERHQGSMSRELLLSDGHVIRCEDRLLPDGRRVGTRVDVTKMRQTEMMLRNIVEGTEAGTWVHDLPTDLLSFSEGWLARYGYGPEDSADPVFAFAAPFFHADDAAEARGKFTAHLRGETESYEAEIRFRRKDGSWAWLLARGRVMAHDVAGKPIRVAGVHIDITLRKSAELRIAAAQDEAMKSHERLVAALDALPHAISVTDVDDHIVLVNRTMRELYPGYTEEFQTGSNYAEIVERTVRGGMVPEALGREEEWLAEFFQERASSTVFDREIQLSNGMIIRLVDTRTPDGGHIGLRIDVTDPRRRSAQLEAIIDGADVGTWDLDVRSGGLTCNRWLAMTGRDAAHFQDFDFDGLLALLHPDDRPRLIAARDAHFLGNAPRIQAELRLWRADGRWTWIRMRGRVIERDARGAPRRVTGVIIDVSSLKEAQAELAEALRQAEQAVEEKSRFLAMVSHEIRTPLHGVLGMAELLEGQLDTPEQARMLCVIRESGQLLLSVINDLLDLTRIESGQLTFEKTAFSPANLAHQVKASHAREVLEKNIDFNLRLNSDAEGICFGDPHRILQVLHNIVGNAVKFTEHGRVDLSIDVDENSLLLIEVCDTGIGMSEDLLAHIYEPFVQADASTARRFGGSGLGMAIVQRLVSAFGGNIDIESRVGEGTRVSVLIPLDRGAREQRCDPEPRPFDSLPELRVLVADDNAVNRLILQGMLTSLGSVAQIVEGGAEALEHFAPDLFDLVLLDIEMPGMDGLETLAALREIERAAGSKPLPVIAVTAHALSSDIIRFREAGFSGHISKPISRGALLESLGKYGRR